MAFDLDQFLPKEEEEKQEQSSFDLDQFLPTKVAATPFDPGPVPTMEDAVPYPEPEPETPTDLSDFGVTPEMQQAPEEKYEPLPIDPDRPVVTDEEGDHSEYTISREHEGKEVLIRTVVDGKRLDPDVAWDKYLKGENPAVGKFDSPEEANKFAGERSDELGRIGLERATPTDLSDFGVTGEMQEERPEEEPKARLDIGISAEGEFVSKEAEKAFGFVKKKMEEGYEPGWWTGTARHTRGTAAAVGAGMYTLAADALDNVNSLYKMAAKEDSGIVTGARDWLMDEGSKAQIDSLYNRMIAEYSTPENALMKVVSHGVRAIPDMAAVIGVTALTRNPNAGYAVMGAQVFSDTYGNERFVEGRSKEEAVYRAAAATAYELGGEKAFQVLEPIAEGVPGGKGMLLVSILEAGSEAVTEGLTIMDELARGGEWEGWAEYGVRVAEAAGAGAVAGGGMQAGGRALQKIQEKMQKRSWEKYKKEMLEKYGDVLDLEMGGPTEDLPYLPGEEPTDVEEMDPRAEIEGRSHEELMNSPLYKKFYEASDLGENSASEESRQEEARESFIRKAEKMGKWKKIIQETDATREEEPAEEGTVEAAVEERREFEETKDDDGPDGPPPPASAGSLIEPDTTFQTNIDGVVKEYLLDEAVTALEKGDLSTEEASQLQEQLDIEQQRTEAEESLDDPRSEERESRPLNLENSQYEDVTVDSVYINAELMQYKADTDREGRSQLLKGVEKWDSALAGVVTLWEDVDTNRVVADGHQRVNLLKELIAAGKVAPETTLHALVYKESEGFSAQDVRTIASMINIAQGSGTAVDAAKVLRDLSEEAAADAMSKLPVNSALVRNAKGLAKLGEEAFQVVVNEMIEPTYGAMIGEAFEEAEQAAAMQIFIKSKPSSIGEAHAMIADIQAGGFVESEQGGLFGEAEQESLIKERAQIITASEKKLRKNAAVFNTLVKEESRVTKEGKNVLDTAANVEQVEQARSVIDRALSTINTNEELNSELNRIAKDFKSGVITKAGAVRLFVEAATAYTERSSREPTARDGVEGRGEAVEEKPEVKEPTKKKKEPSKKKPSEITLTEEVQVEETGEIVTVEENAAQALLRIEKRISVVEQVRDCIQA